jgi:tetratricopeptide (TPR) repeat protein
MRRFYHPHSCLILLLYVAPAIASALPGILEDESFRSIRAQALEQYQQGQFQAALESEKAAYRLALDRYGPTHPFLAPLLDDLAEMQRNLGQYGEAEKNLKWGLALREKAFDAEDPKLADAMEKLVDLYQDLGRYEEAYYLEKRAVDIRKKTKGFSGRGSLLSRLGLLESELGKTAEAQKSLSQAVSLLEKSSGPRNLALVVPLQTRADLFIHLKKWDDAQKDLERILEIDQAYSTGMGATTADALRSLGDFFALRNRGDQSKPFYELALKNYLRLLTGKNGYPALDLMEKAAAADRGLGSYSEALDLDAKSMAVEKEVFGPGHPRTALCEARIAWDERLLGKTQAAQTHRQEAEASLRAVLGDSHPLIGLIVPPESK